MAPIKRIKCEGSTEVKKVKDTTHSGRSKAHNFQINQVKAVQKKVNEASKSLVRVEFKEDHMKIKPNSGSFQKVVEKVKKLKIGDTIKLNDGETATVVDQYFQIDRNNIPFMVKTEFLLKITETGIEAVLHSYITTTYFMI